MNYHTKHLSHTVILSRSASILGFKFWKFAFGGMTPASSTNSVLMIPAIPLVPSRWPMLDFTAPLKIVYQLDILEVRHDKLCARLSL